LEVDFIFLQIGLFEKEMVCAIVKFISVNKLYILIALKSHTIRWWVNYYNKQKYQVIQIPSTCFYLYIMQTKLCIKMKDMN